MAEVVSTFDVPVKGVGKPDYTREISSGRERAGLYLRYNQLLVTVGILFTDQVAHPSPIPWVKPPLAPGASAHLIDLATGLPTPYSLIAGYSITMVQKDWTFNEDIEQWLYFDGMLVACPGISPSGANIYINPVYTYTSLTVDPTAAFPHTWDIVVINSGAGNAEGAAIVASIIEAVGTPPFLTKECMCPFCNHRQTVSVGTTRILCEKCGKTYYVHDNSKIRKL